MGEQRQFFRFRLPWLSAAPAPRPVPTPRPAAEPQPRPAAQTQASSRPTVTIPIQRPPFRPAGITPAQTKPTQVQTEPQPQPAAPSRPTVTVPVQRPPFRPAGITPAKPTPTQVQAPPQKTEPQPVPSRAPIPARAASLSPSRDGESAFKPFGVAGKPSEESTQPKEVAPITGAVKETPTAAVKPKEMEEGKKVAEERSKGSTHEEPTVTTKLLSAAAEAGKKTRELLGAAKEKGKRHPRKEDGERKTWTTSSTDEKQIKSVSSAYPKDRSRPSDSGEKHVDSKDEQVPLHKEIREDVSKFVRKLVTGKPKLTTDEKPVSVITLAGENSGASFRCDSSSDGEESSRGRKTMDSMIKESAAPKAYVNSNTQSINNSIMLESSLEGRNPGVHLDFFNDAKAEPPQAGKSKVLIIGGTGYIGKFIVEASVKQGHPTFALVRESSVSDPVKGKLVENFKNLGVQLLYGDLHDHETLVKAIKQVDVVISAVGEMQLKDEAKIIAAIKEAGNVKRFFPSNFGNDVDRVHAVEPAKTALATKAQIRRAIEAEGIPYTYVVSNCFAGYFLPGLAQPGATAPPREKVVIPGNGYPKAVFNYEGDIGTYTIKAVDDPRTLNKILYIKPPKNTYSFNELVALWEKMIGKTLDKTYVPEDQFVKQIQEAPFPNNVLLAIQHSVFVKGDQTNFEIEPSFGVEASELYPDLKYTTVEEYLSRFV
ncbi:proteoglycan 4-like [Hibiscus syriacus]|uniref:proteoglycan 4-like n=1 Tax=Hibiscus syriacus TaxID=106335 RepID=UPI001924EB11|nr:proteoglycan 4-like [Hibiscus syriacus]